jgi:hypothetical protein
MMREREVSERPVIAQRMEVGEGKRVPIRGGTQVSKPWSVAISGMGVRNPIGIFCRI